MALWLVRAGKHGEHENKYFSGNRIYLTWREVTQNLGEYHTNSAIREAIRPLYPNIPQGRLANWTGQIAGFVFGMMPGDTVIVPRKTKAAFAVGDITGHYAYDPEAEAPYWHSRTVKWLNLDVPRSSFDQQMLYSLGAIMTICRVNRENAEKIARALAKGAAVAEPSPGAAAAEEAEVVNLERLARDQIAKLIISRFKGHEMARLVDAILKAQGYTTFVSPPGPDKGVDILAAPGPLGFGNPRICVQVKSQESPVDLPTLNQLIGTMQNVKADQGLLVAWGGFKSSVDKEVANQFFRVRLWDQDDLIDQLFEQYSNLPEDLRAELPLKRIWTIAAPEEAE